jgi:hypothetical protein
MSATLSKERSSLCSFSFADGRRCCTPSCSAHPHLCGFHARKEAQALAAHQQVGRDISSALSNSYASACDLSSALAYLGQTFLQTLPLAEHEYINAFGTDSWRGAIRSSFAPPGPEPNPE